MAKSLHTVLTRRERQIIDILYRRGRVTAAEVMAELSGNPHYSTVRTQLRVLEAKGHVRHEDSALRYVYMPVQPRRAARKSAGKRASLAVGDLGSRAPKDHPAADGYRAADAPTQSMLRL